MRATAHDRAEKTPTRCHWRCNPHAPCPIAVQKGTAPSASNILCECDYLRAECLHGSGVSAYAGTSAADWARRSEHRILEEAPVTEIWRLIAAKEQWMKPSAGRTLSNQREHDGEKAEIGMKRWTAAAASL